MWHGSERGLTVYKRERNGVECGAIALDSKDAGAADGGAAPERVQLTSRQR